MNPLKTEKIKMVTQNIKQLKLTILLIIQTQYGLENLMI